MFHGAIVSSIPLELEEAAKIDGASRMKIYRSVVLPLLKPTVVTLVIIDSLAIWNDYLLPSLVLVKKELVHTSYCSPVLPWGFFVRLWIDDGRNGYVSDTDSDFVLYFAETYY